MALDKIDRKILALLQKDATTPVAEIGRKVGLSTTPCWRRIQKMEEDGVIKGRVAILDPVKINAVAMRNFSEEEVLPFVQFARDNAFVMRWIEFMPLDADQIWRKEDILSGGEIKALIESQYGPLVPITTGDASETARRYTFSDGIGEVGFINPVSEPFCASCDRIRLTADGQLRTCLFATEETDLRAVVRSEASDEELAGVIRQAVWHKELKHYIGDKRFKRANRSMSMIGG